MQPFCAPHYRCPGVDGRPSFLDPPLKLRVERGVLANERKGPPSHPEGPQEPDRKQPQERATAVPTPALEVKAAGGGELFPTPKKKKWNEVLRRSLTLSDTPDFYLHFLYLLGFQTTFSSVGLRAQWISSPERARHDCVSALSAGDSQAGIMA